MAASTAPPLDEIVHHRPEIIEWHVNQMGGQPMDENMIHRYFSESPFFDHSTKNGLHFLHAQTNMSEFQLVGDRKRFEEDLRRHVGVEYMIVGEPEDVVVRGGGVGVGGNERREKSGVWVIRKQDRRRNRAGEGGRGMEEDLTTLATYYVVGENVYQASSVGDIVGNRLLAATTNLSKFFDKASKLPTFSPTAGYTYLPQQTTRSTSALPGGTSTQASPARSKETSVLPTSSGAGEAGGDSQSLRSTSIAPESHSTSTSFTQSQDARLLAQSFKNTLEYSGEFTDENPILGEPGHFSFTSSLAAVKKRKAAEEEAAALAVKAKADAMAKRALKVEDGKGAVAAPSPPAVMTEAKTAQMRKEGKEERRGSKIMKRKKSRLAGGSVAGLAVEGSGS